MVRTRKRNRHTRLLISLFSLWGSVFLVMAIAYGHEEYLPPVPPPARPAGPTLATVNEMPVTLRDYQDAVSYQEIGFLTPKEILRNAIHLELLRQEAIRLGFDKDPALTKMLERVRALFVKDAFKRELARLGDVSEDEVRQYYQAHKKEFTTKKQVIAGLQPFEDVQRRIKDRLSEERLRNQLDELYADAERKGLIEYKEEAIQKLMAPPPDNLKPEVVLVTINGRPITVYDFGHAFFELDRAGRAAARKDPKPLIRALTHEELRFQEGLWLGLDQDPALVQYLEQVKRRYLVDKVMLQEIPKASQITEEAMRAYYDAHKEEFTTKEQVGASHILLKSREAAETALAQLRNGADFATLARERSEDLLTRSEGGKRFIQRGQMSPEVEQVAFALTPGELSGVVEDAAGFHIIKVHQHTPARLKPFEEVRGLIHMKLASQAKTTAWEQYLAELEKRATIEINEAAFATIK